MENAEENNQTNNTTEPEKAWWEALVGNNPQMKYLFKTLSNPLISIASLGGLVYVLFKEKEEQKIREKAIKDAAQIVDDYEKLIAEHDKLKKKYKKAKKRLMPEEGKMPLSDSSAQNLNGTNAIRNPYRSSYLD